MATRHIPKTLTKLTSSVNSSISPSHSCPLSLSSRLLSHRNFHTVAQPTDADSNSSFSGAGAGAGEFSGYMEALGFRRLDDAIHSAVVRNAAPDWLPFLPGSSYWVPPNRGADKKFVDLIGNLMNPMTLSSVFLDDGLVSEHPVPVEVEMQVHVLTNPWRTSSEDED